MVRPRLTIYVCQESQQLRDLQQKHEDGDTVTSTFFGKGSGAPLRARTPGWWRGGGSSSRARQAETQQQWGCSPGLLSLGF